MILRAILQSHNKKEFVLLPLFRQALTCATLVLAFTASFAGSRPPVQIPDGLTEKEYVNLFNYFFMDGAYGKARQAGEKILKINPGNETIYSGLAGVYLREHQYQKAVEMAEEAVRLSPNSENGQLALALACESVHEWDKMRKACMNGLRVNPDNKQLRYEMKIADSNLLARQHATVLFYLPLLLLFVYYFMKRNQHPSAAAPSGITELLFVSASAALLLYLLFFGASGYIWQRKLDVPYSELLPKIKIFIAEYDGSEGFVLYGLMFLSVGLSVALARFLSWIRDPDTRRLLYVLLAGCAAVYFLKTGFYPPQSDISRNGMDIFLAFAFTISFAFILFVINKYYARLLPWAILILLLPVCFVATTPIVMFDYSYVLAPALRLLHGFGPSEIYFQYDLLLSLLAAGWMKAGIDINLFQVAGQASVFLLFAGLYFFARDLYTDKTLALYLLISLVIIRYYGVMLDPSTLFQVTPLRLDLWLLPLLAVRYRGPYHWLTGLALGALLLLDKNMGLLYLASYSVLCLALFAVEAAGSMNTQEHPIASFKDMAVKHLRLVAKNAFIISGFFIADIVLFKGFIPESALIYQKTGIGFLPISPVSFYWFAPVIFSLTVILLLRHKNKMQPRYFNSALFIVSLAIGNSMYFFGRSHENNILNISAALLLTLFLLVDLLKTDPEARRMTPALPDAPASQAEGKRASVRSNAVRLLPAGIVLLAAYYYSGSMADKLRLQYAGLTSGEKMRLIYPPEYPVPDEKDFAVIRSLTNNSRKVYFLSFSNDFVYYYYGNYTPQGYYNPCAAWIFAKDFAAFLQYLLDRDYYLVTDDLQEVSEVLPRLDYNEVTGRDQYTALKKVRTGFLLDDHSRESLLHVAMNKPLLSHNIPRAPVEMNTDDFTIELIIMPDSIQPEEALILGNRDGQYAGFAVQYNRPGNKPYIFSFVNEFMQGESVSFALQPGRWNYFVISMQKGIVRIFNNGELQVSVPVNGHVRRSGAPVILGNPYASQAKYFRGMIKEVRICNGMLPEQEMRDNLKKIRRQLFGK